MDHVIRGGNIEKIEIICQSGVQLSCENVQTAAKWHRIEIFD